MYAACLHQNTNVPCTVALVKCLREIIWTTILNTVDYLLDHPLTTMNNVIYNSPACFEVQGKNLFRSRVIKLCITWVNRPTGI